MAARFHGQRKLIDTETGEILHTQVVTKSSGDSGFHKIWLAEILDLMEEVGNAKIKVLMWLLSEGRQPESDSGHLQGNCGRFRRGHCHRHAPDASAA